MAYSRRIGEFIAVLAFAAVWFTGTSAPRAEIIYDFTGTCEVDCGSVGLAAGDAVTGSISFGSLDLDIGSFGLLDTNALANEGWTISGTISGSSLTALSILDTGGANAYLFPGPATGEQWELSLSAGGLPGGNGTWTQGGSANAFDFTGDCQVDCGSVGLAAGDAVSGAISLGFLDFDIGSFSLLDTNALAFEGWTVSATILGSSLTALSILDTGGANAYLFPGPATGEQWELSLSAGGLPGGTGSWTLRDGGAINVPEPSSFIVFLIGLLGLGLARFGGQVRITP